MFPIKPSLLGVVVKTVVTHTVTYFVVGWMALVAMDYAGLFRESALSAYMRAPDDLVVMAAPLFQPLRGVLFGVVFYLLRAPFFGKPNGWLVMWAVLVIVGIIGTFGPTPGSLEGVFFTTLPWQVHLRGLPEVILQSLLLSVTLFYWVNHPMKRWLNWGMGLAFVVALLLPVLGLMVSRSS